MVGVMVSGGGAWKEWRGVRVMTERGTGDEPWWRKSRLMGRRQENELTFG
jgi:hypothetical protein